MMMKARHIKCSLTKYHARPEWSHSQIEVLLRSAPLFHGRFISRLYHPLQSEVFEDGTIVHHVLTGGQLGRVLAIIPKSALNADGHRKGSAWTEWAARQKGKVLRKQEECDALLRMIESVRSHPKAQWLLDGPGHFEHTILWEDEATGLRLRARPDRAAEKNGEMVLVDIKTTRACTPREFAADCVKYGYHRQAAWYTDGALALGWAVPAFCFITVDKTPAHECHVYELHPAAIAKGREENAAALRELKQRLDTNNWFAADFGQIMELDLPTWAYREDLWRISE